MPLSIFEMDGDFNRFSVDVNLLWSPLLCHINNEDVQRIVLFPNMKLQDFVLLFYFPTPVFKLVLSSET